MAIGIVNISSETESLFDALVAYEVAGGYQTAVFDPISATINALEFGGTLEEVSLTTNQYTLNVFDPSHTLRGVLVIAGSGFQTTGWDGNPTTTTEGVIDVNSIVNTVLLTDPSDRDLLSYTGAISGFGTVNEVFEASTVQVGSAELGAFLRIEGSLSITGSTTEATITEGTVTRVTLYVRHLDHGFRVEYGGDLSVTGTVTDTITGQVENLVYSGSVESLVFTQINYAGDFSPTVLGEQTLVSLTEIGLTAAEIQNFGQFVPPDFFDTGFVIFNGDDVLSASTDSGVELRGYDGNDSITSGNGFDLLFGDAGADTLQGGNGNDTLSGGDGDDALVGGAGNDQFDWNASQRGGVDTMRGGAGNDQYFISASDVVSEYLVDGNDTVWVDFAGTYVLPWGVENLTLTGSLAGANGTGNVLNNVITGNTVNNVLNGLAGNDLLLGAAGNDRLSYTGGLDTLDGGAGGDTAAFSGFGSAVSVNLGYAGYEASTRDQPNLESGTWRTIADLANVEHVTGSSYADRLTGNGGNNLLSGGSGNDRVSYTGGLDTLDGGSGGDTADFSAFGSAVSVNLGYAGYEASTRDQPNLDSGTWRNIADLVNVEHLTGSSYADRLTGNASNNLLSGGNGNDRLSYTGGLDTLDGGAGGDTADFSAFAAAVSVNLGYAGYEASTRDQTNLDSGTWRTIADLANVEHVTGGAYADRLTGNTGNNVLEGGGSHDALTGGDGADTLLGGAGNDTLTGGVGADRFDFTAALSASTNVDRIADYSLTDDLIRLDNDVFTAFVSENVALAAAAFYSAPGAISAHDADDRIVYNSTTGNLYYDPDGTGAAAPTQFATLSGAPALNAADFFVVA